MVFSALAHSITIYVFRRDGGSPLSAVIYRSEEHDNGICGVLCFCTKQSCSGQKRHAVAKGGPCFDRTRFVSARTARVVWVFAHRLSFRSLTQWPLRCPGFCVVSES